MRETAHVIDCHGAPLVGIVHRPDAPPHRGILMVTAGGPQYRVGGHRQLLLWARAFCTQGLAVSRFDLRGKGDAWGEFKDFVDLDDDIHCAIDHLFAEFPSLREVVLWGECNAASAILYYGYRDPRVTGAVLLNPWVRTEAVAAKATLKHYYRQRLLQPSFWLKLLSGRFNPIASVRSLIGLLKSVRSAGPAGEPGQADTAMAQEISRALPLTEGLLLGLQRFKGRLLVVLSGRDPVAHEFETAVADSPAWQAALAACGTETERIAVADHTFSSAEQRQMVLDRAQAWLRAWPAQTQSDSPAHGAPQH